MDDAKRREVAARAQFACEYCHLSEADDGYSFHVEHVIPRKHGGTDDLSNLAFACQFCNLHKGTNLAGIDPQTGSMIELFNPRRHSWHDHIVLDGFRFQGLTETGRATIRVLAMNDPDRVRLRSILAGRSE